MSIISTLTANPLTQLEKSLIGVGIVILLMFGSGVYGWYKEHTVLVQYQQKVKDMGKEENDLVAKYDKLIKDNANDSEKNIQITANGINEWYLKHPVVRVQPNSCSGQTTGPVSNSGAPNETSSSGSAGWYQSPYSPETTELIGAQLDELMSLLRKDGVKIK